MNRYFHKVNKNSIPARKVPTLEMLGISEESFKHYPTANVHFFEEWYHAAKAWPKDKKLAIDVVHLRYNTRMIVWKGIYNIF